MMSEAEIGLAEADDRIAAAEQNIRQLGSLIPQLAGNGYPTAEVEGHLQTMTQALQYLRTQRSSIIATLDGNQPPPRVAQATARTWRRAASPWRAIYARLSGS